MEHKMAKTTCIRYRDKTSQNRSFYNLFIFSCVVAAFFILNHASAAAGPKASGALLNKAQTEGSVRVIIKLDTSFQPEGLLSGPQAARSQQSRISSLQKQVHKAVAGYPVRGIKKFRYIPYTAMEVDSTTLAALIANPLVTTIQEDVPVPPALIQSVPLIRADQAAIEGYTGAGWAVAILDTGVDKTHPFIGSGKVVAEACFSTTSAYPSTTVCPNGQGSQTGSGYTSPCAFTFTSDQILALEHVYSLRETHRIASVNMSLGGGKYTSASDCDNEDPSGKAAIDNLRSAGIATVIASGNNGFTDGISSPACISTAVSVGASTKTDLEAGYSNYHPTMLSLFAPGSAIYSSVPGGGYATWNGTSMAAPHVAGAWAILKQKSPAASVADLLNNFQTTGVAVTTKPGDLEGGSVKRIDVLAALDAAGPSPDRPTDLSALALSTSEISLNWTDNTSDEAGFKIERKTEEDGTYSQIGTTGANVTTYTDSGLIDGTIYFYRVMAYTASMNSPYTNEASASTPLAAPTGLSATAASSTRINLNWTNHSDAATGFKIERKTGEDGTYSHIATVAGNETQYGNSGLAAQTLYFYRVRAYRGEADSDYSNEASATTPAAFVPVAGGGGGGGGCFIATAAFGSPMEKHVQLLRDFRDRRLLTFSAGRAFVEFYYSTSPPIADHIAKSEVLRTITRAALLPLVGLSWLALAWGWSATLLLMASMLLLTGSLARQIRRRRQTSGR